MRIKKNTVKSIKETAFVVNGFTKTHKNPKTSFLFLASKGEYLNGEYEEINEKTYYNRMGNIGYTITLK